MRPATIVREGKKLAGLGSLFVSVLVLPLCGCESSGGGGQAYAASTVKAPPVQHPALEGIPLPRGFEQVDERSFSWSSGQLRHVNFEFVGDKRPADVNRLYKDHMPSAGFSLRQERFDRGEYVMEFESSQERSTVRIRRSGSKTTLIIDVSPKAKGPVERDANRVPRHP